MAGKKTVDEWLAGRSAQQRRIAQAIRELVLETDPELSETVKWGNPCYEKKSGRVVYIASMSDKYVTLGLWNGANLTDPTGRIEGTGAKMRHVKVRSMEEIDREQFAAWVRETVTLNEGGGA